MKVHGERRQPHGFCSPGPAGHGRPVPLRGSPRYPYTVPMMAACSGWSLFWWTRARGPTPPMAARPYASSMVNAAGVDPSRMSRDLSSKKLYRLRWDLSWRMALSCS
eukprot:12035443-Heterocapsa_arctica.AAC.1